MNDRPAGTGVILVTFFVAALLEVIPMPGQLDWVRPEWLLLVLIYWVLVLPQRIGVLWGFFVGLYHDVLVGTTLGQWGLAYALGAFVMLAAYKRMRVFNGLQQSAVVFLLVGTASLLAFLVQESVGHTLYPPYTILYASATSALFWRLVVAVLHWVQLRFLVR
ncbi:rod shape-determining protein MreD [Alcanivorax hongdengensis A-11-3]|uniref:Rod shape-determining protein MreD n=1 Tax=Alcanivorax hongdengensis A-11-3 TaxID=1177179 RepID=L0WDE6_9GAMM|nr:rod shape-determining protein MreD [Alcanivorax hongdengensis]EKF74162.1 rod shape-determining protein MreD [Alcanivorax hongdengensis A-11-3]